ncbi:UDP-N-acetyl glucosamine 2-epimerase [Desulfosarcina widdelii]|uniref:UDP-N-acetyl glucosamine 2-epimerase n=2 Tax=Desulfosarcina widdelii TaxID=947919 RepID=A0A5K7Z9X1_9BACT|nr:UDP-N-acetyl glucosamine 2-epimerase [Desulfosarcina widdelii]
MCERMKIVTIIGARPQFIKSAPFSKAVQKLKSNGDENKGTINELVVHTGQHFDANMSDVFFEELNIPKPAYNLQINSTSHGIMTGRMIESIESILMKEMPDWVMVYGDTNSTLAGALAAVKLNIPIVHVEAGLRSYNRKMPEEINRVLTDQCADCLFCPTRQAVKNLEREGFSNFIKDGSLVEFSDLRNLALEIGATHHPVIINVGDTMYDAVLQFAEIARKKCRILDQLEIHPRQYLLATIHRQYNTDCPANLLEILSAFIEIDEPIIFPVHPRTKKYVDMTNLDLKSSKVRCIPPVGYLDMLTLEQNSKSILTDSGGIQKEAYFFGVPCITLRTETEWVETVETGWNVVVGTDRKRIVETTKKLKMENPRPDMYGDGKAAEKMIKFLFAFKKRKLV